MNPLRSDLDRGHVWLLAALVLLLPSVTCASADSLFSESDEGPIHLEQGWDDAMRERFYFTPQGSRLIPYAWFLALEQPESSELFASEPNLAEFGWLYSPAGPGEMNPDGLPIGFTRDPVELPGLGPSLGFTCAACHTGAVKSGDRTLHIDGAPSMVDFGRFLAELGRVITVNHPAVDKAKFKRFAGRVLGAQVTPQAVEQLAGQYTALAVRLEARIWIRTASQQAGPGRVDALGQIINALASIHLGNPSNLHRTVAPTSFPFLWLTPKLDWVQWNPIAANPIARNAGEVLGVFGVVNFGLDESQPMLASSVQFENLFELEQWVDALEPPRWPEDALGKIDETKWRAGLKLFNKDCRACHNMPPFDMTKKEDNIVGKQFIKIKRVPYKGVGTDPLYIESLVGRFVETGNLGPILFDERTIVPAAEFFLRTVGATVRAGFDALALTPAERLRYSDYRFHRPSSPEVAPEPYRAPSVTDLKAGPLLGIWATGPYLHNGSVPNIYELISPPEERAAAFWVGGVEVDADRLGFVSTEAAGRFRFDATLAGNRNSGHIYPKRPYDPVQRMSVIEYLKDPERFDQEAAQ